MHAGSSSQFESHLDPTRSGSLAGPWCGSIEGLRRFHKVYGCLRSPYKLLNLPNKSSFIQLQAVCPTCFLTPHVWRSQHHHKEALWDYSSLWMICHCFCSAWHHLLICSQETKSTPKPKQCLTWSTRTYPPLDVCEKGAWTRAAPERACSSNLQKSSSAFRPRL